MHRLGLPGPLGPLAESDLVAALSELVGFDPEPGVYCWPRAGGGPGRAVGASARCSASHRSTASRCCATAAWS